MTFVGVTLDSLSGTGTLDPETKLHPLGQLRLRALCALGEKFLNAILSRHLHKFGLPPQRVDRVMPLARHGVLPESERIGTRKLVRRLRGLGAFRSRGENRCGWIPGKEALPLGRKGLR